jgi:hypothetical protein
MLAMEERRKRGARTYVHKTFGVVLPSELLTFEDAVLHTLLEVGCTLVERQRKYTHENIDEGGLSGIYIRLRDKLARFKGALYVAIGRGADPLRVTAIDTDVDLTDVAGYGIILLMYQNGTFFLPPRT